MIELVNDEDLMVRLEAIEGLVDILNTKLNPDQIERDLLPHIV